MCLSSIVLPQKVMGRQILVYSSIRYVVVIIVQVASSQWVSPEQKMGAAKASRYLDRQALVHLFEHYDVLVQAYHQGLISSPFAFDTVPIICKSQVLYSSIRRNVVPFQSLDWKGPTLTSTRIQRCFSQDENDDSSTCVVLLLIIVLALISFNTILVDNRKYCIHSFVVVMSFSPCIGKGVVLNQGFPSFALTNSLSLISHSFCRQDRRDCNSTVKAWNETTLFHFSFRCPKQLV